MSDTWDRRNIPVNPGYNNPLADLVFTVVYNDGTDEVTVTANRAFFGDVEVESLVFTSDTGPTTLEEGVGFTTTSSTVIVIPNAATMGAILEQLDFYGEGAATGILRGVWAGSVALSATQTLTYDSGTDTLTITDPLGSFTADVDFVAFWSYSYPIEAWAPDVIRDSATQVRVTNAAALTFETDGTPVSNHIHHVAVAADATTNYPNTVVFEEDVAFAEFENPNYPVVRDLTSPAAERIQLDGVRFLTGATQVLNQVQVVSDIGPNLNYYDPAGPDSGLNPVGATIVSWTDTQVIIEDSDLTTYEIGVLGDIHGADSRGYLRLWGGTSGAPVEVQRFTPHPMITVA